MAKRLTRLEMATRSGVSVQALSRHIAAGAPVPRSAGPKTVAAWLVAYQDWRTKHGKVAPTEQRRVREVAENAGDGTVGHWQRERQKWLALRSKTELELLLRQLVRIEDVEHWAVEAVRAVRQHMEAAVRRLPLLLSQDQVQAQLIETKLRDEFDSLCQTFADAMEPARHGEPRDGRSAAVQPADPGAVDPS